MNLKIKILVLFIALFLFGDCSSEVSYSSLIINYDFHQLDGVLIYNRDIDLIGFEFFRVKASGLVFIDNHLRITKKTCWRNYFSAYLILPMGLSLMKFTYCRMVSALILPMILANKPFVIFA